MITAPQDRILKRLRVALDSLYGERIERVVLFGSRARGDADNESDYDVAVFLNDLTDRWGELYRLADLRADFLEAADVFIDAKPYPAGAYRAGACRACRTARRDLGRSIRPGRRAYCRHGQIAVRFCRRRRGARYRRRAAVPRRARRRPAG